MKIKKLASLALAAVLTVTAMTGCGKSSDDPNSIQSNPGYPDSEGYAEGILGTTMHTEFFDFTINSAYTCASYEVRICSPISISWPKMKAAPV